MDPMQFPDASMIRASLTTVAVAATMHHIKVPRGITLSKVEVILSVAGTMVAGPAMDGGPLEMAQAAHQLQSAGISKPKKPGPRHTA